MNPETDPTIAALVAELQPVRPLRQRDGMIPVLGVLALAAAGTLALLGPRADLLAMHPDPLFMLSSGLFLILALASAWMAVDQARPHVGAAREGWGWTAMMAAVLPVSALVLVTLDWLSGSPGQVHSDGLQCFALGTGWSLLTFGFLTAWLRRGAPSNPERSGLLAGVAAGSAGIFAVSLCCPENSLVHIGLWHGGTVLFGGMLGRLVLPRLISW
jgi:hypothetical protein